MSTIYESWVIQRQDGCMFLWWCADCKGCTTQLLHAGVFTEEEARSYGSKEAPEKHVAIPLSEAIGRVKPDTVGTLIGLHSSYS